MSDMACTYDGRRDEILVAYLYDELSPGERAAFDAHLAGCGACRIELAEFEAVRSQLARWSPPEPARVLAFTQPAGPAARRNVVWSALADIPAWTQVAAALLVLGVAAGIANLQITYGADGMTVRTGWSSAFTAPADAASARPGYPAPGGAASAPPAAPAPWSADLAALERDLRTEMQKVAVAPAAAAVPPADPDTMRRVRALIDASERNQRRELALRVAEVAREVQVQRVADLQRIQRNFTLLENTTGGAIVRQGRLLDNLAIRVSQQQ